MLWHPRYPSITYCKDRFVVSVAEALGRHAEDIAIALGWPAPTTISDGAAAPKKASSPAALLDTAEANDPQKLAEQRGYKVGGIYFEKVVGQSQIYKLSEFKDGMAEFREVALLYCFGVVSQELHICSLYELTETRACYATHIYFEQQTAHVCRSKFRWCSGTRLARSRRRARSESFNPSGRPSKAQSRN